MERWSTASFITNMIWILYLNFCTEQLAPVHVLLQRNILNCAITCWFSLTDGYEIRGKWTTPWSDSNKSVCVNTAAYLYSPNLGEFIQ